MTTATLRDPSDIAATGPTEINILRISMRPAALYTFASRTGISRSWGKSVGATDPGYIVHGALANIFGDHAPKPFYLLPSREVGALTRSGEIAGNRIVVLGYSSISEQELRERANSESPLGAEIVDWGETRIKKMPTLFSPGKRLLLTLKFCPVVRARYFSESRDDKWDELDAYLAAIQNAKKYDHDLSTITRPQVYHDWILSRLEKSGIAVESANITSFQLVNFKRRDRSRKFVHMRRPAAEVQALVSIQDPALFRSSLINGVGRHKAFGFGMIRLSPP